MRQKEGVRVPLRSDVAVIGGHEAQVVRRCRLCTDGRVAHQPLRDALGVHAAHGRERLCHLQTRHTHAEGTRDELEIHKPLLGRKPFPLRAQALGLRVGGEAPQRQQVLMHPPRQAKHWHRARRRW